MPKWVAGARQSFLILDNNMVVWCSIDTLRTVALSAYELVGGSLLVDHTDKAHRPLTGSEDVTISKVGGIPLLGSQATAAPSLRERHLPSLDIRELGTSKWIMTMSLAQSTE